MSKLNGMQIFELLSNVNDNLIVESVAPTLLVGGATTAAAGLTGAASTSASAGAAAAKAGFGAWLAKGGWAVLLAGVVVAVGVAVGGSLLLGRDDHPTGDTEMTSGNETYAEETTETEEQTEAPTEPVTHPCDNGHTVETWETDREPTCYRQGELMGICTVCGETVTQGTDTIPHTPVEGYCSVCGLVEGADERFVYEFESDANGGRYAVLAARNGAEGERIILPNVAYDPETDGMVPVGVLGQDLFLEDTVLREVVIPDTVTLLRSRAFDGCTALETAHIPSSVTEIGRWVFARCTSLTEFTIPGTVRKVGDGAFLDSTAIERFTMARMDTMISLKSAFGSADKMPASLKTVILTEDVPVPQSAFNGCTYLTEIILPETVTEIGDYAFRNCTSLETINLPDSLSRIGLGMFDGCTALREIVIPEGVAGIAAYAFRSCESLTAMYIPDSVKNVDYQSFDLCKSLTWISLPNSDWVDVSALSYGGPNCFFQTVIFRDGTTLNKGEMEVLISLHEVYLPATITLIDNGAFRGTYLTDIYFAGTEEQWKAIEVGEHNERLERVTVHFNSTP